MSCSGKQHLPSSTSRKPYRDTVFLLFPWQLPFPLRMFDSDKACLSSSASEVRIGILSFCRFLDHQSFSFVCPARVNDICRRQLQESRIKILSFFCFLGNCRFPFTGSARINDAHLRQLLEGVVRILAFFCCLHSRRRSPHMKAKSA